ncbi:MAG: MraY family glycosyltransferase [Verrucomicrobiota bacterium]
MAFYKTYWVVFIMAGVVSLVLTPLVIWLAKWLDIVDHPGNRKIHQQAVPLLGGLAVAVGMWLPVYALSFHSNLVNSNLFAQGRLVLLILLSGFIMLLVGVVDDIRGLNARKKFLIQLPIAVALVLSGVRFSNITIPGLGTVPLDFIGPLLSIIWIIGITNAINLVDGLDGLAVGVALFAAGTNALIAIIHGNVVAAVLLTALTGACLGFLPYNTNPARVFLGDTGSLFLGMTLAVSSMITAQKGIMATSMLIPVLVLGYPIADTLLSMTRRAIRGKSMFSADAGHIHHRLLHLGLTHRQSAFAIYLVCALFSLLALVSVFQNSLGIAIGLVGVFFVSYTGLRTLGYWKTMVALLNSPERMKFKALNHYAEFAKCKIAIAENQRQIIDLLQGACQEYGKAGVRITLPNPAPNAQAIQYQWFLERDTSQTVPPGLTHDNHEFDSGLKIQFYFIPKANSDELHLEKRNLLAKIAEAADERFSQIMAAPPS